MEQGKIDSILSSRPEDRRAIFEEAAGITKYKSQKKEALRKLENTEANLVRLADIIREVKRQIGSLQRQAGKARRYQASFEELAELETKFGAASVRYLFHRPSRRCRPKSTARARSRSSSMPASPRRRRKSAPRASDLAVVEAELVRAARGAGAPSATPSSGPSSGPPRTARAWRNSPACATRPGRKSPARRRKSAWARSN